MNIVALIKQVPDTETRIKIGGDGKSIDPAGVKFIMNPYDEFAVEEAIRIKEKHGGSVTAVTLGPERAMEALRSALAMGADRAVFIQEPEGIDNSVAAKARAAAVKEIAPDLILVGKQAIGDDEGRVGPAVAAILDLPFVSNAVKIEFEDSKLKVHREIEGMGETVETSLPAVLSCQKGLNEPRYPSLIAIMQAKKKPVEDKAFSALGVEDASPATDTVKLELPPERPPGRILQGEPAEVAAALIRLLAEEAKVI